ncbi:protein JINGUBANG-like [Aristolochia californica]|uniref:protein JINGUBANG-like n=1 Tax=Aristolochia californica TaxID=171875 RepID=UPI0035DA34C3
MGVPTCGIPACHSDKDSQSGSSKQHLSETSSLYSQPSLPSVPSLTSNSVNFHQSAFGAHHQCISTLKGHSSYVFSLALAGKFLYSGSANSEIRVWDARPDDVDSQPANFNVVVVAQGAMKSMVISGDKLFTAHQDQKIRVWRIGFDKTGHTYKLLATLPTLKDRLLRYLPPKNYVQVRRHKKCTWVHHVDAVSALAMSGDGSTLYSASWDRSFKVWRISDCACLESVGNAHDDAINAIAVSGDGFVYTGSADTKIKVWRRSSGKKKHNHYLVATLEKHRSAINALALSWDGSVLYSGACDRSIVVWERGAAEGGVAHMAVVGALRGHTKAILCLAVAADLVLSGSADKSVRIWRRSLNKSYSCLGVLEGHRGPIKCLTVALERYPDKGRASTSYSVYSGSMDCEIKVWQLSVPSSWGVL